MMSLPLIAATVSATDAQTVATTMAPCTHRVTIHCGPEKYATFTFTIGLTSANMRHHSFAVAFQDELLKQFESNLHYHLTSNASPHYLAKLECVQKVGGQRTFHMTCRLYLSDGNLVSKQLFNRFSTCVYQLMLASWC